MSARAARCSLGCESFAEGKPARDCFVPWIVYETRCLVSGKIYIGVHKQDGDEFDGYLGSGTLITAAVEKHGRDNFRRQTLFAFESERDAYAKEAELVGREWVDSTWTYNIKEGGIGGVGFSMPEEAREKIREYRTGRPHSEETKEKIRQHRAKIAFRHTSESRAKMSASRKGIPHSEERKQRISDGMKRSWQLRRAP
jgi:hypothetical protein